MSDERRDAPKDADGRSGAGAGAGGDDATEEPERAKLFERAVPEVIRSLLERALERGVEKISEGPENLRNFLGEMKLPKDVLHFLYGQIDDTKKGLYRVVAKEIRDVLEHTKFADEIADVLTKLSFEINTQIRFVPNSESRAHKSEPPTAPERPEGEAGGPAEGEDAPSSHHGLGALPRPRVFSRFRVRRHDWPRRRVSR
jgi:hypothetical protein